jgi:hypothetical protein
MEGVFGTIVGIVKSDEYDGALSAIMKLEGARREVLLREVGQVLMAAGATTRDLQSEDAF